MSIIHQLATSLNRRDEVPNQELAAKIVNTHDHTAVNELIGLLQHKNKNFQADSIKVLYEIGYLRPELIASHYPVFLNLLKNKNNRMVWGAMAALDMITLAKPEAIYNNLPQIMDAAEKGSVITKDRTVKLMAKLAAHKQYQEAALLFLMEMVEKALINQLPSYTETTAAVMTTEFAEHFKNIVQTKLLEVEQESKRKRLEKALKKINN